MKTPVHGISLLCLTSFHQASAHYGFPFTVIGGVVSKRWEYVRPTTKFNPVFNLQSSDAICGYNATLPSFPVKTLKVAAGSEIGFAAANMGNAAVDKPESEKFDPFDPRFSLYHAGPAAAYFSKAPTEDLNSYNGDGSWFKFAIVGASDGMNWDWGSRKNKPVSIMNFTIPASTPPGHYLLRVEHLNMYTSHLRGGAEVFTNCAHVEVTGNGQGTPEPLAKFPLYTQDDPDLWLPILLARPYKPMDELKNWQGAGPAVWKG